jgi:hypothetical protein
LAAQDGRGGPPLPQCSRPDERRGEPEREFDGEDLAASMFQAFFVVDQIGYQCNEISTC